MVRLVDSVGSGWSAAASSGSGRRGEHVVRGVTGRTDADVISLAGLVLEQLDLKLNTHTHTHTHTHTLLPRDNDITSSVRNAKLFY